MVDNHAIDAGWASSFMCLLAFSEVQVRGNLRAMPTSPEP